MDTNDILWWSHGGKLHGESTKRIEFLHSILTETPGIGLAPVACSWDEVGATVETHPPGKVAYYLYYYGFMRPSFRDYYFDDDTEYIVEVIDTWNMTIENKGIVKGNIRVELPGIEYMAVRIRKTSI